MAQILELLAPAFSTLSPTPFAPIQSIKITTEPSISWQFLLFIGTYYAPLSIDPGFQALLNEVDGTGSEALVGMNLSLPAIWELLFTCHGTGIFQIELQNGPAFSTPGLGGAQTPCDGRLNSGLYNEGSQGEKVTQIQITTGAENDWQVAILGCAVGNFVCGS